MEGNRLACLLHFSSNVSLPFFLRDIYFECGFYGQMQQPKLPSKMLRHSIYRHYLGISMHRGFTVILYERPTSIYGFVLWKCVPWCALPEKKQSKKKRMHNKLMKGVVLMVQLVLHRHFIATKEVIILLLAQMLTAAELTQCDHC